MDRQRRIRKSITIETKKEIIHKHENGASVSNLSLEYRVAKSTICTILKNKCKFKNVRVAKGITKLSKSRNNFIEEMENLLLVWIKEKEIARENISESMICVKAKQLFDDLVANSPSGNDTVLDFLASKGWFTRFRKRNGLHNDVKCDKSASADHKVARNLVKIMPRLKKYKTEAERRAVTRQRARIKRANETPLERDQRLMNLSLNEWHRRRNETFEERKERLKRLSLNARKRRAKETAEERANRLRKLSENVMKRRAGESSQKRNKNTNKCASKPNCHNTQVAKRQRGRKPTAKGIKIALTNCYDDQEKYYLEQMHQDPGKFEAPIEKSELNSIQSSQHSVETKTLQKVSVENNANLKQQTKATTRAQRNQLISVNTSNEVNSKLCKTNSEILLHPQSAVPPVQEKRILVVPNHQTAVMSNLFSMWKAGRLCDSYISNGTTTIMVHKMVLGAVCPKLLPILHHSSKGSFPKVTFPSSVSKEGLLAFAEYMYSGVLDLNEEILVQLKTIGERLSMKDFEQLCCNELNKAKTKDILSAVVEPLLAEPCSLSGLFPSRTHGDTNEVQNSMLIKLFRNNYCTSNNMQRDVLVSTGSSTSSDVRTEEIMTANQIIDIQREVEPETASATDHNSLQLKIEPYSPGENQHSFQEELCMDIGNTSSNNNHHQTPATSATSANIINTDNDLTVTYSDNQYKNYLNMVSCDSINISDTPQSEEICLSQHTEDCDKDTDNQKELRLISITSVAGNINEDNLSNNSDLVEISSTMPTNTTQLQTSNSKPYPISLFSVNNSEYTAL